MLNVRTISIFAVLLLVCATAQAAQLGTDPNAGTDIVVRDVVHPLAPQTITQNTDPDTLVDGTSVACVGAVTTENSWSRLFDLDGDHGLVGAYTVESVDWGVQGAVGALNVFVRVYCLDQTLPYLWQFTTLQDEVAVPIADEALVFHNTAIGGTCDSATEDMPIELWAEDCNIVGCVTCFIGMNNLGQSAPTYIASASCGVPDPANLSAVCFGISCHLVMVVNGQDEVPPTMVAVVTFPPRQVWARSCCCLASSAAVRTSCGGGKGAECRLRLTALIAHRLAARQLHLPSDVNSYAALPAAQGGLDP